MSYQVTDGFLLTRVLLKFESDSDDLLGELSAIARTPDGSLWVGADELTTIERLKPIDINVYGAHTPFNTQDFVELFDPDSEIDIEGLDYSQGYLWVIGSHSFKRKKPKGKKVKKDIQRLTEISKDDNRYLLARFPVLNGELVKSYAQSDDADDILNAAMLAKSENRHNILMDALAEDEHLGPFIQMKLPSKDNGLDIEGLTVCGQTIFLGLRGPVLRGWAIILELQLEEAEPGFLTLRTLENGELYRKHFVDLNGLGIRELCLRGEDLIILAGATMAISGSMQVFELKDVLGHSKDTLWDQESGALRILFDLPFTVGSDNAEGLTLFPCLEEDDALMVVYDSPDDRRRPDANSVFADVFRLP